MRLLPLTLLISHRRSSSRRYPARRGRSSAVLTGGAALLAVLVMLAVVGGALWYASLRADLPAAADLAVLLDPKTGTLWQPTRLYDRSGKQIIYTLENPGIPRRYLSLDPSTPLHFSPLLVQVIVSAEDPDFWRHPGVTWESLRSPVPLTLAERLVDRLLLDGEPVGWRRALRGRLLAMQVIARYGRGQVLEWYLNSAYFGHLAYGADRAAWLYLGKSASDLSLAEVAMLVATEEAPALNPVDTPKAAIERQAAVLDRLLVRHIINDQDYLEARASTILLTAMPQEDHGPAAAFARLVISEVSQKLGRDRLERGGLRIITSLDYGLQLELDCAARSQLLRLDGGAASAPRGDGKACATARLLPALPPSPQALPAGLLASGMVLDVRTGEVLAYAGPLSENGDQQAAPAYQPGSLLTPFVALASFARGLSPASLVWDVPANDIIAPSSQGIEVKEYHGPLRLRIALANDYLPPFTRLLDQIGPENVWRLSAPLGLEDLERTAKPGDLLYRGGDASLLDLAQAYSTLANLGVQSGVSSTVPDQPLRPSLVLSIKSLDGQVLQAGAAETNRTVLSAPLAYLVHDILADDAARSDSLGASNPLEFSRPAAAKAGRTEDGSQVWTVGYTPQRLALTWVGLSGGSSARLDVRMAAGLWNAVLQAASQDLPAEGWSEPAGISHVPVCDPSGLLPTPACPNIAGEIFLKGSEPTAPDNLYRVVQLNRETGRLATVFTPPAMIEEKTFFVPPPEGQAWAEKAGIPQAPLVYDAIQLPDASPEVNITAPQAFAHVRGQVPLNGTAAGEGFASYRLEVGAGLNPQTWLQVGEEGKSPVQGGALATWDTRGQDGLYALRLQVVRQDNRVDSAIIQVTVDNTPPRLQVVSPSPGQVLPASSGATITLQAQAEDNIGVTRLEWYLDGRLAGAREAAPFTLPWQAIPGKHSLVVKAYDAAGNQVETGPLRFEIQ